MSAAPWTEHSFQYPCPQLLCVVPSPGQGWKLFPSLSPSPSPPGRKTGIWKRLLCLGRPRTASCSVPFLLPPAVRAYTTCFLKGSLPFPVLRAWPRPPGVAAMNLKDLKRLRLLLDFISRGPDASGPHLEPQRLCDLLRPLSRSGY